MFDVNNNPTNNAANATVYTYNITMLKTINGRSSSNMIISKISTLSSIQSSYI
jgi:hypothetical protein